MRLLRTFWKGGLLTAHLILGGVCAALRRGRLNEQFVRRWCRIACRILRLRVHAIGVPADEPALFVANHVSWLEVVALGSVAPVEFVAKDDVARWPIIGPLAAATGTLFLRRGCARAAARAAQEVALRLASGRSIALFPEGTSTIGESVLPFRAALFEAAARVGCAVQPVAIFYPRASDAPAVAPFVDDDEFLPHLLRALAQPRIDVELAFAPAINGRGKTREELAGAARNAVASGLADRRRVHLELEDAREADRARLGRDPDGPDTDASEESLIASRSCANGVPLL